MKINLQTIKLTLVLGKGGGGEERDLRTVIEETGTSLMGMV